MIIWADADADADTEQMSILADEHISRWTDADAHAYTDANAEQMNWCWAD